MWPELPSVNSPVTFKVQPRASYFLLETRELVTWLSEGPGLCALGQAYTGCVQEKITLRHSSKLAPLLLSSCIKKAKRRQGQTNHFRGLLDPMLVRSCHQEVQQI